MVRGMGEKRATKKKRAGERGREPVRKGKKDREAKRNQV